ncbi:MAG: YbjN domain-containing protein [Pseudomonadota bacterium]
MSVELLETSVSAADPLDVVEAIASETDIGFERVDPQELHLTVTGGWSDLTLWFAWRPEYQTLQVGAPIEMTAPKERRDDACRLLAMVNENLWLGHFDIWADDGSIVYRHAAVLPEDASFDAEQAQLLIQGALEAYDRFYPAFDLLLNDKKSPEDAMALSLFETAGSA